VKVGNLHLDSRETAGIHKAPIHQSPDTLKWAEPAVLVSTGRIEHCQRSKVVSSDESPYLI
jgi:hypothetical protein